MFNNLKISIKLFVGFGLVILVGLVLFLYNYTNFKTIQSSIQTTKNEQYPLLKEANKMMALSENMQKWFIDLASKRDMVAYAEGIVEAKEKLDLFNTRLDSLIAKDPDNQERLEKIREPFQAYFDVGLAMTMAFALSEESTGVEKKKQFDAFATQIQTSFTEYYSDIESDFYASIQEIDNNTSNAIYMGIIIGILSILFGIGTAYFIARKISSSIAEITNIAVEVSKGDLEQEISIHSKDELGVLSKAVKDLILYMRNLAHAANAISSNNLTVDVEPVSEKDILGIAFKTMTSNLSQMITEININANELVKAVKQITESSDEMAVGAEYQKEQVDVVSASIEEMAATITESSFNATEATKASQSASDTATKGGDIVQQTISGMINITKVVRESAESISRLATSADQIGAIISTIDEIADQTNLLALNAAIEAARAGEQGRGFAVVADEVRKLAERTGKATSEITSMIKGIQNETNEAVQSMEMGIQEVDKGKQLSDNAGDSLREIVNMSQQVSDMVEQIAVASEQQSKAASEITKNIEDILEVTTRTSSGATRSSDAAKDLNRQADSLKKMVGQFQL
ncbi:MAG: methyl-accepting chemotaxis protein [Calditrichaeota bacterium]|nr:MAG: methyl-accepting chemotaxis protein [Calditrichota bacterium]